MKHLRKYNESTEFVFKEDLITFCNDYLAYLVDDGLDIKIVSLKSNILDVYLRFYNNGVKWDDIKDSIIPFLEVLTDKYDLVTNDGYYRSYQITFSMLTHSSKKRDIYDSPYMEVFTIDEIINEEVDDKIKNTIQYISFELKIKDK